MPDSVPTFGAGTATTTPTVVAPARLCRQLLVENRGDTNGLVVSWNGASGGWTIDPGARLGLTVLGGVVSLELTAAAATTAYQYLLQP